MKVLIIANNEVYIDFLKTLFKEWEWPEPICQTTLSVLIEDFDLVIWDIDANDISKAFPNNRPVVAIVHDEKAGMECIKMGAQDFIIKDGYFNRKDLLYAQERHRRILLEKKMSLIIEGLAEISKELRRLKQE